MGYLRCERKLNQLIYPFSLKAFSKTCSSYFLKNIPLAFRAYVIERITCSKLWVWIFPETKPSYSVKDLQMVLMLGVYLLRERCSLISKRSLLTWALSSTPKNDIFLLFYLQFRKIYNLFKRLIFQNYQSCLLIVKIVMPYNNVNIDHQTLYDFIPPKKQMKVGASSSSFLQQENTSVFSESQFLGVQTESSAKFELMNFAQTLASALKASISASLAPLAILSLTILSWNDLQAFCQSFLSKEVSWRPKASTTSTTFSTSELAAPPSSSSSFFPPKAFPQPTSTSTSPLTIFLALTSIQAPLANCTEGQESEMISTSLELSKQSTQILMRLQQSIQLQSKRLQHSNLIINRPLILKNYQLTPNLYVSFYILMFNFSILTAQKYYKLCLMAFLYILHTIIKKCGVTLMIYDSKSMKKTTKKIKTPNTFYMKGSSQTQYRHTIIIDFQPQKSTGFVRQQMRQLTKPHSLIPTFNPDAKIYTPTFFIPSVEIDEEHCSQKFDQKLAQYQQIDLEDINVPRPRNKDYCNVCEEKFTDYLEHSLSNQHREELRKNKFQKRIQIMCRKARKRYFRSSKAKDIQQKYGSCSQSCHQESLPQKGHTIQNT